jgi:riboflavin biosynthesis pyrimidine reductase
MSRCLVPLCVQGPASAEDGNGGVRVSELKLLERLFEVPGLAAYELPPRLTELYDGVLGFDAPRVYANFVSSIDGVVALPSVHGSPSVISRKSEADRFVMGLLRSCADVVLLGAGTLRAEPHHRWTPEFIYPPAAGDYALLRRELGLSPEPRLAVVTSAGDLDPGIPALESATVLTTPHGARRLDHGRTFPATVLELGVDEILDLRLVIDALRSRGDHMILSEGGPTVIGQLLDLRVLDELFLTLSPILVGRSRSELRPGIVEGVDLLDDGLSTAEVLSVHRHRSHLFVRYLLASQAEKQEQKNAA